MTSPLEGLPRAIAVVGPTASGKAALGREIARALQMPILVCDSVKVYRGLDIGSAKPSAQARTEVVHHLIDLADPDETFSAGDYAEHAWDVFERTPGVFVGGTGLYLRATAWTQTGSGLQGAAVPTDDPQREAFEARIRAVEAEDVGAAHRALQAADPEAARGIHPHNLVRILRALWLCEVHGRPVSQARKADPPRPRMSLCMVVLDPGAERLGARIDQRIDAMLEAGWLAEVEKLREAGYDARYKSMRSLGYRQLLDVVEGRVDLDTARASIRVATRQYARRQRTYFRRQIPADEVLLLTDAADCPIERLHDFVRGGPA